MENISSLLVLVKIRLTHIKSFDNSLDSIKVHNVIEELFRRTV